MANDDSPSKLRRWLKQLPERLAENLLAAAIIAGAASGTLLAGVLALLDLLGGHVSVPVWSGVLAGAVLVAGAFYIGFWTNRRVEADPITAAATDLIGLLDRQDAYLEHLWTTLEQLQSAVDGAIDGTNLRNFIERGVLYPGRDMLKTYQPNGEDVRLSVLRPVGEDFVMAYSAGHTNTGHAGFRMKISDSFSKHAYEQGVVCGSSNLSKDPRFAPRPGARRPYESIVSIPLRSGGETAWVFNAIFTAEAAIVDTDYFYILLLAAITNVALVADNQA